MRSDVEEVRSSVDELKAQGNIIKEKVEDLAGDPKRYMDQDHTGKIY